MPITYDWSLQGPGSLECVPELNGQENVVRTVHWRLTGSDGTFSGVTVGSQKLDNPEGDFTPYAELTLDQVIGWAKDAMGAPLVALKESAVADQIAVQANRPMIAPPLPWEQPPEA
ncbi:DUF7936 family protein [Sphingomonas sp. SRS2]|uniref:DUF7936 family protein n=1 Tax=Sphingomonas sp. SRS2 TaxID=133190 RepID=UPI0006184AFA|nr:hypothetical protein [Sphingomonas sp. SRS2]KKC24941.1 hypothetical protein WP12_17130 [Sphingomonas sp. SRS2]